MKFFTSTAILTLAATALAMPAPTHPDPPTTPPPGHGDICPNNSKQLCCNGLLSCLVQSYGGSCNSDVFCCQTSAPTGSFISIAILSCINIL